MDVMMHQKDHFFSGGMCPPQSEPLDLSLPRSMGSESDQSSEYLDNISFDMDSTSMDVTASSVESSSGHLDSVMEGYESGDDEYDWLQSLKDVPYEGISSTHPDRLEILDLYSQFDSEDLNESGEDMEMEEEADTSNQTPEELDAIGVDFVGCALLVTEDELEKVDEEVEEEEEEMDQFCNESPDPPIQEQEKIVEVEDIDGSQKEDDHDRTTAPNKRTWLDLGDLIIDEDAIVKFVSSDESEEEPPPRRIRRHYAQPKPIIFPPTPIPSPPLPSDEPAPESSTPPPPPPEPEAGPSRPEIVSIIPPPEPVVVAPVLKGWFYCAICFMMVKGSQSHDCQSIGGYFRVSVNPQRHRHPRIASFCLACRVVYVGGLLRHLLNSHRTRLVRFLRSRPTPKYIPYAKYFKKVFVEAVHRCGICEKDFTSLLTLQTHLRKKHGPAKVYSNVTFDLCARKCNGCCTTFPDTFTLLKHVTAKKCIVPEIDISSD